jgi:hypothetical protein
MSLKPPKHDRGTRGYCLLEGVSIQISGHGPSSLKLFAVFFSFSRPYFDQVSLWQDCLQVLQFSPVSIIPPMLHTHSYTYNQRCIMFLSKYFSFPCQYHSTNAPYSFIHLPPTLYNVSLPVLQFPLSVSFHQCSTLIHLPPTLYNISNWQRR